LPPQKSYQSQIRINSHVYGGDKKSILGIETAGPPPLEQF